MSNSRLLAAILGGAAAGAILGVLIAPQSGADTRKQILKTSRQSAESLNDLIEEGKKTWYETKGKAKMGAGIAADELDDFMHHILNKGQSLWSNAKNKAGKAADEAEDAVMSNGKKAASFVKEHTS
ncbi:MAG: YtxH domain-containing protein [Saprospiraceae bacterium]